MIDRWSVQGTWGNRCFDLSFNNADVNHPITSLGLLTDVSSNGTWDIYYEEMAIISSDGSTIPIIASDVPTPAVNSFQGGHWTSTPVATVEYAATGNVHFYVADQVGTSLLELSSGGVPLWRGEFVPYGLELDKFPTSNNFKYTGKERDSESGLDYFGARYYSSSSRRFMSPDWSDKPEAIPYAQLADPQSFNLYSYATGNPLSRLDPDGHKSCSQCREILDAIANGTTSEDALWAAHEQSKIQDQQAAPQQQNASSGGGSFWPHVGNLFHGHSWNYVKTTVTDTETYTVREPNEAVTAATDAAGLAGMAAPALAKDAHLGPLGAGASIFNDPSVKNIFINLIGLTDLGAAPVATTGAFNDFLTWGAENGHGRVEPKAYNSDQLTPTLPTQDGGCAASGLPSC